MGKKCLISVMFMLLVLLYSEIVFAGPSLIISEVLFNEPGNQTSKEWIEIFNPTLNDIDLTDYKLGTDANTYPIPNGTTIKSGETIVFAKRMTDLGFTPDFDDLNLKLLNGGEKVELKDPSDLVIDFVAWKNFISGWSLQAGDGQSIKRIALPTSPSSWLSNQTPNPGSPAPIPEPGTLLLLTSGLVTLGIVRRRWKRS